MPSIFRKVLDALSDAAEDGLDAAARVATNQAAKDEYARLLWLMKADADSIIEPAAGGSGGAAGSDPALEEYGSAEELLADRPGAARYRDSDNSEGPLFWAALYGPPSLVERLEALGADPMGTLTGSVLIWTPTMETLNQGGTPLMMAAFGGHADIVRHFLERGVAADAVATEARHDSHHGDPDRGDTALFMATQGAGTAEVVQLLAEAGGDPNGGDYLGFTPLGKAAERGAGELVEALLAAGADATVPSGSTSVLELAGDADDSSAMRALLAATAGRLLTLSDVTLALDAASIPHEVIARVDAYNGDMDLVRYMSVYGEVMDELHNTIDDAPTYFLWACRSDEEIGAIGLEDTLESLDIGPRRFASDGEMKALLGIAEGGITLFAEVNDAASRVVFDTSRLGGDRPIALEAFDENNVIVLQSEDAGRAREAFNASVGPPPLHP